MLEHLRDTIGDKDTSEMTPEELQFYYFKQHDYDNNNMLDGIELIQGNHYIFQLPGIFSGMFTLAN